MAKLTFRNSGPKIAARQIRAIEEQLGSKLPEDYRRFLLRTNGGTPSRVYFDIPGQ